MKFTISNRNCAAIPYSLTWKQGGTRYEQVFDTVQACMDYATCIDRRASITDNTGTLDRWHKAVSTIGAARLLNMPVGVQNALANCSVIDAKVRMLEAIIDAL